MPPGPGRPLGSRNKVSKQLLETLQEQGFEPAVELIKVFKGCMDILNVEKEKQKNNERYSKGYMLDALETARKAAKDLADFTYPKFKSISHTGADGESLADTFSELIRKATQELPKDE